MNGPNVSVVPASRSSHAVGPQGTYQRRTASSSTMGSNVCEGPVGTTASGTMGSSGESKTKSSTGSEMSMYPQRLVVCTVRVSEDAMNSVSAETPLDHSTSN